MDILDAKKLLKKNKKAVKSINSSIHYALFLTTAKSHGQKTPLNSVSHVQKAIEVLENLPMVNTNKIFSARHLIPAQEAISFVKNDYWKHDLFISLIILHDLQISLKNHGSLCCHYSIRLNKHSGEDYVACSFADFGDLLGVIYDVKKVEKHLKHNVSGLKNAIAVMQEEDSVAS